VAWLTNWGAITVLPGTSIGVRNELSVEQNRTSWYGFDLRQGRIHHADCLHRIGLDARDHLLDRPAGGDLESLDV